MATTVADPRRAPLPPASWPAVLGLVAVTVSWGSTFFLLKDVVTRVPVADFLAVRFVVAALAVAVLAPRSVARLCAADRRRGVGLGLVYGAAQLLQTFGLQTTAASVSGFLTGMYVVFTPLLGAFVLGNRLGARVWAAVALATAGLAVLSLQGLAVGGGEALTLLSALLYGVHLVAVGQWTTARNAVGLTVVQLATVAALCGLAALPGGVTLPDREGDWLALLYMALVAGALAMLVQTWAQSRLAATRAAVIMTMEPAWAATFAVLLGGERLGPRVVAGGALVLAATCLVEQAGSAEGARVVAAGPALLHVGHDPLAEADEGTDQPDDDTGDQ